MQKWMIAILGWLLGGIVLFQLVVRPNINVDWGVVKAIFNPSIRIERVGSCVLTINMTTGLIVSKSGCDSPRLATGRPAPLNQSYSGQGSETEKSTCLRRAGFLEAQTPEEYYRLKYQNKRVFYISGSGKTTVPSEYENIAVSQCGGVLGPKR